jgi:hypothetical protein
MNYSRSKIKNIFKAKFKAKQLPLDEQYIPKIDGYKTFGGFILENGTDIVDGEEKDYLLMKVYMKEGNK